MTDTAHDETVRDTIRRAASALDDLLFHELGAHRCGGDIGDGLTQQLTGEELQYAALNWADRLEENAARLRAALTD
ncbi:hypothetical protein [Streptomyces niveus]|uniref:hypothetical protein n=1 Tax=Streptomyces niveus TaxID=193462 RepID=UPI003450C96E